MLSRTKIASVVAGGTLALSIASVAGAASASADNQSDYIYDLNNHGIGGSKQNLLDLGENVACKPAPPNVAVDAIVKSSNSNLNRDDATFLYDSAKTFLCPPP
jgi:uncharacterized protein (DUF2147 family)